MAALMGRPPPSSTPGTRETLETLTYDTEPAPGARPRQRVDKPLERGSTVHRYLILDRVGEGGMGVIYAAYDPSLDRRVALKFLHNEAGRGGVRESRLIREAQAMARLSHPHVAVAYEVGHFGGQVFLAMELVDGVDLRRWLAEKPRSRSRILEVFLAAGGGLAAAHAAGIVHRDFKPENVLIGADDRPRVTDFGLSRASRGPEEDDQEALQDPGADSPDPLSTPSHLSIQLTRTGGLLGTPGYKPPEQNRGVEADARADQFGFCVALCEALTGSLPFGGDTPAEIAEAMVARRIDAAATAMPRWLRPVVMRGLEPDPGDRWPSMDALLEALSRDPRAARRRWLAGGAVGIGLAAVASLWLASRTAVDRALPIKIKTYGEEHVTVAGAMRTLGDLHLLEVDPAAARAAYQRSLAIHRKQDPDHPDVVPVLIGLGRAQLEAGQRSEAVATLERAAAKADAGGPATRLAGARARFQLARALWAARERPRAAALARTARDRLAGRREADEIDGWLLRHAAR